MRFTKDAWPGLADGSITVTFRRWKRCQVVVGNHYRSPAGMLAVDRVDQMPRGADGLATITDLDARSSGAPDRTALIERLGPETDDAELYRVEFHLAGPDPRDTLRETIPDEAEIAEIIVRLDRLDARSSFGPWTRNTLRAIAEQPGVRAPDLAESFGRETKPFKLDVRKLKGLGLTESLKVGYQISPRGQAVLDALD